MKKASNYAFINKKSKPSSQESSSFNQPMSSTNNMQSFSLPPPPGLNRAQMHGFGGLIMPRPEADLNVFVVTFEGMKNA
jgi:hypothetical protein